VSDCVWFFVCLFSCISVVVVLRQCRAAVVAVCAFMRRTLPS